MQTRVPFKPSTPISKAHSSPSTPREEDFFWKPAAGAPGSIRPQAADEHPGSPPKPLLIRRVRIKVTDAPTRAQLAAGRKAAKTEVLAQMSQCLEKLASRKEAASHLDAIQSVADKVWRTGSRRQDQKLREYFLRVLPNMDEAERSAIREVLGSGKSTSPVARALWSALQSPAARQPRRALGLRHSIKESFNSFRSNMTVLSVRAQQARAPAVVREAERNIARARTALLAGQPGRAIAAMHQAATVLRTLEYYTDESALARRLQQMVTAQVVELPLAEVEAIAACGPRCVQGKKSSTADALASGIADALTLKRLQNRDSTYTPEDIERLVAGASNRVLDSLILAGGQSGAAIAAQQLRQERREKLGATIGGGLVFLTQGRLDGLLSKLREAAHSPEARRVDDGALIHEVLTAAFWNLSEEERSSVSEWLRSPQFDLLVDTLRRSPDARWGTAGLMLQQTRQALMPDADAKSSAGGRSLVRRAGTTDSFAVFTALTAAGFTASSAADVLPALVATVQSVSGAEEFPIVLDRLATATAGASSPRAQVRAALLDWAAGSQKGEASGLMVRLRQRILSEERGRLLESYPEIIRGMEDAIDEFLQPKTVMDEALADLSRAEQPNERIRIAGSEVDSGVGHGLWADIQRRPYYSVLSDAGKMTRTALIAKPPGEGQDEALYAALRAFASRIATGKDATDPQAAMARMRQIGKFAMQSIWEPLLRTALTSGSPFRVEGLPGWLNGPSPTSFDITPAADAEGGHLVTARIRYEGTERARLKFQNLVTGAWEQLAAESYAEGTLKIRVLPDGSARCEQLPVFECSLVRDPDGVAD